MQNWYKNVFIDVTVLFELLYMQIWTALLKRDYTGSELGLKHVSVLRELANKLTAYENPLIWSWICVMLTFKSISFQIS